MDRAWKSGASATPPTAPISPSVGYATGGNPGGGVPATKPGEYWYHMITEELRAIVVAGGLTPAQGVLNQVLTALQSMFVASGSLNSRPGHTYTTNDWTWLDKANGLIIQWGYTSDFSGTPAAVTFPANFTTQCFGVVPLNYLGATNVSPTQDATAVYGKSTSGFNIRTSAGSVSSAFYIAVGV